MPAPRPAPAHRLRVAAGVVLVAGKAAVGVVAFNRWVASLWHGRRLAYTLAAGATVVALLCLHIAGLMTEDVDD